MTTGKRLRGTVKIDLAAETVTVTPRRRLLRRATPTVGRVAALETAHNNLAASTELFEEADDCGRSGIHRAIMTAVRFFESQGVPQAALTPLLAVGAALNDAENGISTPAFTVKRKSHRPRKTMFQITSEEYLAVVMELCVRHFRDNGHRPYLDKASKLAAAMVNKSHWQVQVTATKMRGLRESVTSIERGHFGRQQFDIILEGEPAATEPLLAAKLLLASELVVMPQHSA